MLKKQVCSQALLTVTLSLHRWSQQHSQAVLVLNHPRFVREASKLAALSIQHRLPMATPYRQIADAGGLIAHHPDWEKIWRRGASVIQRILDGTPPIQIPVQTGDMRYYINVKTADALGLAIPASLREQAQSIGPIHPKRMLQQRRNRRLPHRRSQTP